jgi:hypothetical protein
MGSVFLAVGNVGLIRKYLLPIHWTLLAVLLDRTRTRIPTPSVVQPIACRCTVYCPDERKRRKKHFLFLPFLLLTVYKLHISSDPASTVTTRSQPSPFRSLIRESAWNCTSIERMAQKLGTILVLTSLIITEFQKVSLRFLSRLRRGRVPTEGPTVTSLRKAYPM